MKRYIRIAIFALLLSMPAASVLLLSGCNCRGTVPSFYVLPQPVPTMDPHRNDRIEDGELNWSYWPDVVKTPVFGEVG